MKLLRGLSDKMGQDTVPSYARTYIHCISVRHSRSQATLGKPGSEGVVKTCKRGSISPVILRLYAIPFSLVHKVSGMAIL